jgi:hypothetical protein
VQRSAKGDDELTKKRFLKSPIISRGLCVIMP